MPATLTAFEIDFNPLTTIFSLLILFACILYSIVQVFNITINKGMKIVTAFVKLWIAIHDNYFRYMR